MEVEHFKDSDHHKGYFCYNCVYFVKPHHCAIVIDEGMDILGRSSGVIPPHVSCSLWMPNEKEIYGDSSYRGAGTEASIQSESEESTHGVSASFSCEICSNSFASREETQIAYDRQSKQNNVKTNKLLYLKDGWCNSFLKNKHY